MSRVHRIGVGGGVEPVNHGRSVVWSAARLSLRLSSRYREFMPSTRPAHPPGIRTAGIDLATEPDRTGLAVMEWAEGGARVVEVRLGASNDDIVGLALNVELMGIDCAFGWPDAFVDFVAAHRAGEILGEEASGDRDWRRSLAYRATDRAVHARTGRWPLSVATDRLGLTALRCAVLLNAVAAAGAPVDRSGAPPSRLVEVYPAAALRCWEIRQAGYKSDAARRAEVLDELLAAAPWLEVGMFREVMLETSDALDAVLSAIVAGFAYAGAVDAPRDDALDAAAREGWIALPSGSLAAAPSFPAARGAHSL